MVRSVTNLAWLQKVNEGVLQVPLHLQLLNKSPPAARKSEHLTRSATEVALWVYLPWQGQFVKEWAYGGSRVKVMQTPFSSGTHLVKQLPERQICLRVLKKLRQQQRSHNDKLGFCSGVSTLHGAQRCLSCPASPHSAAKRTQFAYHSDTCSHGNQPMSGETLNVHLRQAFEVAGEPVH